jgi:zinc/manganese transport system substrate-binding protein
MKSIFSVLALIATLAAAPSVAHAKLNVVATLPDFGSIAEAIGGDKVKITNLTKGTEDPHFVDARPSFITILNKADVLLDGGLELEIGWLPPLINAARNPKILSDGSGRINLSRGVHVLDIPTAPVDRSMGDVHPFGNPHYWLDPANGKVIAANISAAFSKLDAANAGFYAANLAAFNLRIDQKIAEWSKALEPLRGTKVVTYHKSFDSFLERFELKLVATIEPKPGIEPSPTHINALIPLAKEQQVKFVMVEPNRPRRTPAYVAESIGAKLVVIPQMVGGHAKVKDYFGLFDYAVAQILEAQK